jgi:hypothetical protein
MSCSGGDPPNNPIEELKERVRICEMKIQELEQQLQQCKKEHEDEKTKLKRELGNVNKEKDFLEKLIHEKKSIEKSFNAQMNFMKKELNGKIKELIGEMNSMKEESKEEGTRLKEDSKKKDTQLNLMGNEIGTFSMELKDTKKELKDTKKELKDTIERTKQLEKSRDRLYVGQLCANVQEYIYMCVLPIYFQQVSNYRQPHVKDIDKNINELCGTNEKKRQEARGKWRKLQREIGLDLNLVDVMEGLLKERHEEAHPYPLDDDELEKIANELPGEKQQNVKKIIQISKKLKPLCNIY